jgi:hypothetical protein
MRAQLAELVALTGARRVVVVDVGGDILAAGHEPGLRSPLADGLALAASCELPAVVVVAVVGLGLDGELTSAECDRALADLMTAGSRYREMLIDPSLARAFRRAFRWLPSEATGLACLAAQGYRGRAEIRGEGLPVSLDDRTARVHLFECEHVLRRNALAQHVMNSSSLHEAENALRVFSPLTEIDRERLVMRRRERATERHEPRPEMLERLQRYSRLATGRGVDFLTIRRVAEVLEVAGDRLPELIEMLERLAPRRVAVPIWMCRPQEVRAWNWPESSGRAKPTPTP